MRPGWIPSFAKSSGLSANRALDRRCEPTMSFWRPPWSVGFDQRDVHEVLGHEPDLQLVAPDDVADEQIVGTVVAAFGGQARHRMGLLQDDLVGVEKARNLNGDLF